MTTAMNIAISMETTPQAKIASLVADGQLWAKLHEDNGAQIIEFHPRADGKPWSIPYFYAVSALEDAKRQLQQATQPAA